MKMFQLVNCYTTFLAASFLSLTFQLQAIDKDEAYISSTELHEVLENHTMQYVYLGKEFSDLYEVVSRISTLDDNDTSVISELQKYIEDGFSVGLYDSVLETLGYAEKVLQENSSKISLEEFQDISYLLNVVIDQVVNEELTINAKKITDLSELNMPFDDLKINRDCSVGPSDCCSTNCCPTNRSKVIKVREKLDVCDKVRFKKDVKIDCKLKVCGKAVFKGDVCFEDDVTFKDDVEFKDEVEFKDDVEFEEDVTIEGALTVTDLVVLSCIDNLCVNELTVIDIIIPIGSCIDNFCINTLSVTDLVVLSCMDNLCVETLSVTDLVVLSCMDNLCVETLSVTDLVVLSCMDSLCVNDLSAVDASISGTLSVNNAVIENLSVTDVVIIGCIEEVCVIDLSVVDGSVSGTLSVADLVVLSCMDNLCVETLSVTDLVVLSCMDNLCVETLSVTDLVVLSCMDSLCVETLSVTDLVVVSCMDNLCVETLSVTDLVVLSCMDNLCVETLSVTDLVVLSCMDSLCVIDLSVVDESVSGTLSVNDLVAEFLDIGCDLTIGCNLSMNDSTSSSIGNIIKGGDRFMHNFGTDNTFLGINAGNFTMSGDENVGIGRNTLFSNTTGVENNAVGGFALVTNTIGTNNNAMGAFSLTINTTGNENTAIGGFTLTTNTTGSGNTAVGFDAGFSLVTGDNNVFVGNRAALLTTTGSTNVIIGYNAGLSLLTGSDNIYISNPGIGAESGIVRIGTSATHTTTFVQGIFGVPVGLTGLSVFVDAAGQLGTVVSSRRFKHDIADMNSDISENVYKLRPVTFVYNSDETDTQQYGLIAEEVDQAFPELVVYDKEGAPYTIRYQLLPILLLNEVQKLNNSIQDQAITMSELKMDNAKLNEAMQNVIQRVNQLHSN